MSYAPHTLTHDEIEREDKRMLLSHSAELPWLSVEKLEFLYTSKIN
jgi:hypothetical protein